MRFSLFVCVAFVACSRGLDITARPVDGSDLALLVLDGGATEAGANEASADAPLRVVQLTSTSPTITGGEPLATESSSTTFVAIVTDGAGSDDIAGGELLDDGGATYAAFGAGANKGTFSVTLDWTTVNSIRGVEFVTAGHRQFTARFFDNSGHVAAATVDIALTCRSSILGLVDACGGACVSLAEDGGNCGRCGQSCLRGQLCSGSACVEPASPAPGTSALATPCTVSSAFAPSSSCQDVCTRVGIPCESLHAYFADDPTCSVSQGFGWGCSDPIASHGPRAICSCFH